MINWKLRIKDVHFWIALLLTIVPMVLGFMQLQPQDITTWAELWNVFLQFISNPFMVFSILMVVYNALRDPTTSGFKDSARAMSYERPVETAPVKTRNMTRDEIRKNITNSRKGE